MSVDLVEGDRQLIALVNALTDEAAELAGPHLACHAGCSPCCFGPFAITQLDAWRLRRGLMELSKTEPDNAAGVRRRAAEAVTRQRSSFPNDHVGTFASPEQEQRLYDAFASDPCPVLDPDSGSCLLYASRPICCRTYGPPVRIGGDDLPPCPLCFKGAGTEHVEAARHTIDVDEDETRLITDVERQTCQRGMTTVAFAIGSMPDRC